MHRIATALAALLLTAGSAFAHVGPGAVHDFSAGLLHPPSGLDHVAAAVAVGLWAMLADRGRPWIWPLTFVSVMALATVIGAQGTASPYADLGVAGTVIALGLLVLGAVRLPTLVGAVPIALFAFVHGYVHGAEGGAAWPYLAGLAVATALLHGAGLVAARTALHAHRLALIRATGAAIAAFGVIVLVG